ncbi:MAG: ATP-binding protein [Bacillota bacterium]|nr:ATP-binding protein [Bacillota bacterium]
MNSFLQGIVNMESLMTIFNSLEDMVFLVELGIDGVFRVSGVNPAYIKGAKWELLNYKNKPLVELFSPEETAKIIQNYKNAIYRKQALSYEEKATIDKEIHTFETTIIPLFLGEEQASRYILGVTRDISERKKYENALIDAKNELKKVLQHQQGLILKAEKHGNDFFYSFCDGQLVNWLYVTTEEIIGCRPQDLFPESIASTINKHYHHCWETKEKVIFETFDPLSANNHYMLAVVSPIIENEVTTSLIIYAIDISERKKAEESLMKAEKLALIGELAAGIGHELRNPLTSIRGFIKLMKQNKAMIKDEFLDVIDNELESLNRIAGELMILAKPQAVDYKKIDMIPLLNEVTFLLESEVFRRGMKLSKVYKCKQAFICGDKQQLKQVMINLIKNAIEATECKVDGKIIVECRIEESEIIIEIIDNGYGIPKELIEKIGEPFYTTKEKGTGLGLMVSYRIIKNHEGTIICDSEEGKGTSFVMSFPIYFY